MAFGLDARETTMLLGIVSVIKGVAAAVILSRRSAAKDLGHAE